MPIREYCCLECGKEVEEFSNFIRICCGREMKLIPSAPSIVISGNIGKKLKNRVALDDELETSGFSSPLYRSEETKDIARWALKKEGLL